MKSMLLKKSLLIEGFSKLYLRDFMVHIVCFMLTEKRIIFPLTYGTVPYGIIVVITLAPYKYCTGISPIWYHYCTYTADSLPVL